MGNQHDIVFEDLHGQNEDEPITVDLDADSKDDGIERKPADKAADADAGNDDEIEFEDLRSADNADDQDDEDDPASKDGGDDDYSKRVKARIEREARAKRKAKQEADSKGREAEYWKKQAEQLAKDRAGRDKEQFEQVIERASSEIESTQADLERAIEDGNTKDQVRLTSKLTDLKAEKIQAELTLKDLSDDGQIAPFDDKVSTRADDKSTTPRKADEWTEAHSDWYGARGFERQTRLANRIDREVFADGFDPNSDEYFEELDRRIKEKEPSLYDDAADDDEDDPKPRKQRRTPVAPVDREDSKSRQQRGNKVELTEEDFANMRRFNLNPNDPEVLKEYARNKRETLGGRGR